MHSRAIQSVLLISSLTFCLPAAAQDAVPEQTLETPSESVPAEAGTDGEPAAADTPSGPAVEDENSEDQGAATEASAPVDGQAAPPSTQATRSAVGAGGEESDEVASGPVGAGGEESDEMASGPVGVGGAHLEDTQTAEPLQIEFDAGHGLSLATGDGEFTMNITPRLQLRATLDTPQGADPNVAFLARRARLTVSGHFFGEDNRYKLQLAFSPADLGMSDGVVTRSPMLDYYLDFRELRDLNVRVGQYKLHYTRERVISSSRLQMVDRSVVNGEFTWDRDLGFELSSTDLFGLGFLHYYLGLSMGEGRDGGVGGDLGFLYYARVEVLPLGNFGDVAQVDMSRSNTPRLALGASYSYFDQAPNIRGIKGSTPADGGSTNYHGMVADMLFLWRGFSLTSEMMWRQGTRNTGGLQDDTGALIPVEAARNGIGVFVQAGFLLPGVDLEITARYGLNRALGDDTSLPERNEAGVGLNYYFAGYPFRMQLDAFQLWSDDFGQGDQRIRLQLDAAL